MLVLTGLVLGVGNRDLPDSTQHWVGATFLAWAGTNQFPLARLTINIGMTLLENRRNSPKESGGYIRSPWASGKIVTVVLGVVLGREKWRAWAGGSAAGKLGRSRSWPISVDYRMRKRRHVLPDSRLSSILPVDPDWQAF
jgi:hypothetical protein